MSSVEVHDRGDLGLGMSQSRRGAFGATKNPSLEASALTGVLFNYRLLFPAFLAGAFAALRGAALAFFTAFIMNTSFPRSVAFD